MLYEVITPRLSNKFGVSAGLDNLPAIEHEDLGHPQRRHTWKLALRPFGNNRGVITSYSIHYTKLYETDGTGSSKGIKGVVRVSIDGGAFNINSADDTIHSNDNITINGGTFTLSSADDGVHADSTLEINDGDVQITKSRITSYNVCYTKLLR